MNITYEWFNDSELKEKGYAFTFVLYPDSNTYDTDFVLKAVKMYYEGKKLENFAYILHDKDEGKPHYHIDIKYKNQMRVQTVLNDFALWNYNPNEEDIIIRSWRGALNYLIHNTENSKHKYQYPTDEVVSSIPEVIDNLRISKDKIDIFNDIIDYISSYDGYVSTTQVLKYCRSKDEKYLKVMLDRQYNYTISNVIKEHNII